MSASEIPWWAGPVLYAILTGILGPIIVKCLGYLGRYIGKRKEKRLEKEKELRLKIQQHIACRNSIDYNIKNLVLTNELPRAADLLTQGIPQEFSIRAKEYVENYQRLYDWLEASKLAIGHVIGTCVQSHLPITQRGYDLVSVLEHPRIIHLFMEGTRVNKRWLEENHPEIHTEIIEHLKEPETETRLNIFFLNLNRDLEKNNILRRFRKEKKELIEHGKELMKDLDNEIQGLKARQARKSSTHWGRMKRIEGLGTKERFNLSRSKEPCNLKEEIKLHNTVLWCR